MVYKPTYNWGGPSCSCACITTPWPCRCFLGVLPQLMETRVVMPGHKIWEATPEERIVFWDAVGQNLGTRKFEKFRRSKMIQRPLLLIVTHNQSIPTVFGGSVYHLRPRVLFFYKFAHKYGSSISRERVLLEFQPWAFNNISYLD